MAIDQNAMYRAGFSSRSTGRNTENDARERKHEFWKGVGNQAYSILGNAAIGQMKQNHRGLQEFRNVFNSTAGKTALTIDEGLPNPGLKEDLNALSELHRKANRKAHTGFGKARSKAAQEAAGYRQQLADMKSWLDAANKQRVDVQGMTAVASGLTQAGGDQGSFSSGASEMALGNSIELAEGSLLQRGRWNYDATKGPIGPTVSVGGEWKSDKLTGKNSYVSKSETGTYEDYLAEDAEVSGKLDLKYEKYVNEQSGSGVADGNIQSREDWNKSQNIESTTIMSEEDWTAVNQQNRGLVSQVPWSNLKFAEKEDKTTGDNLGEYEKEKIAQASSKGSLSWENVEANEKEEFFAKMDEYTDLQFRDYFFGGGTYEASATRMSKSAPAYQFLMEEDMDSGNYSDDGGFEKGFGPGSENWAGRMLSLRGQSFVSGSQYRKTTAEQQWKNIGDKYKRNQRAYIDANPTDENNTSTNDWVGYDLDKNAGSYSQNGQTIQVTFGSMKDTSDTILNIEEKGKGNYKGYDGTTYFYSKGKWGAYGFNDKGTQVTVRGADKNTMLSNLGLSDKPRILDYLGMASTKKETTSGKNQDYVPKSSTTKEEKQRQGIITTLQGWSPKGYNGRSFASMDMDELQRIHDGFKAKTNSDIMPTPKFLQK